MTEATHCYCCGAPIKPYNPIVRWRGLTVAPRSNLVRWQDEKLDPPSPTCLRFLAELVRAKGAPVPVDSFYRLIGEDAHVGTIRVQMRNLRLWLELLPFQIPHGKGTMGYWLEFTTTSGPREGCPSPERA